MSIPEDLPSETKDQGRPVGENPFEHVEKKIRRLKAETRMFFVLLTMIAIPVGYLGCQTNNNAQQLIEKANENTEMFESLRRSGN